MRTCHGLVNKFVDVVLSRAVVLAALICIAFATVSCRTIKETEYVTVTQYIHDTTEVYVHDTTKVLDVRHDSVDRYVEKVTYVDTNGVVHEREIERLTKYIMESSEKYIAKENEYKMRIKELESKSNETVKEVLVEKPLRWWQKTLMFLGVVLVVGIICFVAVLYIKTKT